ncbi:hypothetical protein BGZ60DRAFT_402643 [Tricladium varicosporioides]|nr:hypothetical protein BGZ60DRAFT_402643 [Hymenoscyphus varicosporioides]
MYGNNYANIGSVNSNKPGTYLLRRVQDVGVPYGLNTTNPPPGYAGIINSPTTYGFILIRILLLNRGSDIDMVKAYQIAFNTELVERNYTSPPQPPALTVGLLAQGLSGSNEEKVLQLTARLAPYNPPEEVEMIGNVTRILELAGLKNGTYTQPADTNLTDATAVARLSVRAELMKPYLQQNFGNNWHQLIPEVSGNFGSDFAVRAYIAETALAQLTTEQALYPTFSPPNATDELLNVGADEAVMFTFSGKPPVVGFWSLTIYGEDFYLIPNEVGVYSLGDRSNITFADGAKIYSGGGVWNSTGDIRDGQFQILVQPANVVPPGNWTGNWLPAPSGGGKFLVNLRWYGPTGGLSDGKYVYPVVSTLTAMRA